MSQFFESNNNFEKYIDRQRYIYGESSVRHIGSSHALILGLGGLGFEVAKNLILSGFGTVSLNDNAITRWEDLSTNVRNFLGNFIHSLFLFNKNHCSHFLQKQMLGNLEMSLSPNLKNSR